VGDPRAVDLLYVTNRRIAQGPKGPSLSGERGSIIFGRARVRIPDDHNLGQILLPGPGISVLGLITIGKEEYDPKKHFAILAKPVISREYWNAIVNELKPSDALIFVHGFNTTFDQALLRNAQVVWDLKYTGLPVLFSWPSRGNIADYFYDRDSAEGAREHFIRLLKILRDDHGIERVHVLAHSMGNHVVLPALANHSQTRDPIRIAEVIMAAPDVDRNLFEQIVPHVRQIATGLTLYASAADKALMASKRLAGKIPRAGDVPDGGSPIVLPGLESIDVTALGSEMLGLNHSVFAESRVLVDDIGLLIRDGKRAPRLARVRPMPERAVPPQFWRMTE
jgi:esterase/lipase superfamily enzyme